MAFEYPSNYYVLRRVLSQRIGEKISSYDTGSMHRDELLLELRIFARELANDSGASLKLIYTLFAQRGVVLSDEVSL